MRLYTIVVSIAAHVAVLIVLVIVPIVAMDSLPAARTAIEFFKVSAATAPEVPPPPRSAARPPAGEPVSDAAPLTAPDRISPEIARAPVTPGVPIEGPGGVPGGFPDGAALPVVPVPPQPPRPQELLRPGGDIRPPQKLRHVAPVYPPLAQTAKVQGTVVLEAVIGENGRVRDVRILRSISLLDRAAMDAVRQWQFTPTLLNGVPVPIVMTVTVTFELK